VSEKVFCARCGRECTRAEERELDGTTVQVVWFCPAGHGKQHDPKPEPAVSIEGTVS